MDASLVVGIIAIVLSVGANSVRVRQDVPKPKAGSSQPGSA